MCLRKMFASYPRSAYLGYSFHHRGCSVAVFLDGLLVKSILFVSLCAVNVLDVKNICMFAEWCPLQTCNDMVQVYTSPRQSPIYIILTSPAPPFPMPPPRPPQKPEPKQRPPTNRPRPLRQPLIQLRVPGRRSHWNDDQKDVIEAEENGEYQEAGCRIWYRRRRVPRRE